MRTETRCPAGRLGEILTRGDNIMLGYWNRPEETAAALRGGWLHTGDLATWTTRATSSLSTGRKT